KEGVAVTFVDWSDLTRWKLINSTLDLGFPSPEETYSTSPHFFSALGIPEGTKGTLPKEKRHDRAGLDAEELEDIGETGRTRSHDRGRDRERPRPRRRKRNRTRTRAGRPVDAAAENGASADDNVVDAVATERKRSRTRRRTRAGKPAAEATEASRSARPRGAGLTGARARPFSTATPSPGLPVGPRPVPLFPQLQRDVGTVGDQDRDTRVAQEPPHHRLGVHRPHHGGDAGPAALPQHPHPGQPVVDGDHVGARLADQRQRREVVRDAALPQVPPHRQRRPHTREGALDLHERQHLAGGDDETVPPEGLDRHLDRLVLAAALLEVQMTLRTAADDP